MPPRVFCKKSAEVVENKGRESEKERKERQRGGKRLKGKMLKSFRWEACKLGMRRPRTAETTTRERETPGRQGLKGRLGWGADFIRNGSRDQVRCQQEYLLVRYPFERVAKLFRGR